MSSYFFSSRDIPEPQRREAVADHYGDHVGCSIDFLDDSLPANCDLRLRLLGAANIAHARYDTMPVKLHTPAQEDLLYLGIALECGEGPAHYRTNKAEFLIRAGDVNVMRTEERAVTTMPDHGVCLSIGIPRERIPPRLSSSDSLFRTYSLRQPIARLLSSYAMTLMEVGDAMTPAEEAVCAEHLADLAVLMLGAQRDEGHHASQRGARAALRVAIEADIHKNLILPELSLDWIAARHGVSPAYVRALFADRGASFTDYVLGARLDYARTLLRLPHMARHNIASLALMAGFGDISWFNKAFRRRFGVTPSDWRHQPAQPGLAPHAP